jgi:hypothetical protein
MICGEGPYSTLIPPRAGSLFHAEFHVSLRDGLLRARRDGESHQGTPTRPLRRPDVRRNHARQPAAPVVCLDGLCPALRVRRIGRAHIQSAAATCGTLRLALLKIGALLRISVRTSIWHRGARGRTNSDWPTYGSPQANEP